MTVKQPKPEILIVRPPYALTGKASEQWFAIESAMAGLSANILVDDPAEDFFIRVLTQCCHLKIDCDLIERAVRWFKHGGTGFQAAVNQDLEKLDRALASASKDFFPATFHWYGFSHPGLNSALDVMQFADDGDSNPFRRYADQHWQPFDASAPPAMAIFYIDRRGAMGPAVSMGRSFRIRWPDIPLKLICPESFIEELFGDGSDPFSDQWPFDEITGMNRLNETLAGPLGLDLVFDAVTIDRFTPFQPNEGLPLIADRMPLNVQAVLDRGTRLVVWRDCGDETGAVTRQLYAASRKGLWNHLILNADSEDHLTQFAAANANIVHSYCHAEKPSSEFSDPVYTFPSATPTYGRTQPMPGRPLWMMLKAPSLIDRWLARHPVKTLMRMRVREDDHRLFEVGKQLRYHFKRAQDLPAGHLDEIVRMVEAGGSVNTQFVRHNLERAYLIAYVEEEGVIVGNSSLKQPREEYIDAVSRQSGIDLHDYLERGYTSVRPEYRGLGVGAKLLEGLTERAGQHSIFSVIAENNVATQKMAMRNRTRRVATFFSQRAKKEMSVWIPEWMLPEGVELPPQPDLNIEQNKPKG